MEEVAICRNLIKKWKSPMEHIYKVNFDGAVDLSNKIEGIGVVVRDSSGDFMGAYPTKASWVIEAETIEALAAAKALYFASSMSFREVEVKGDASGLVVKLQKATMDFSIIENLVDKIKSKAATFSYCCCFMHVKRSGNEVAHQLTKHSLSGNEKVSWVEDCPELIQNYVKKDVISLSNES